MQFTEPSMAKMDSLGSVGSKAPLLIPPQMMRRIPRSKRSCFAISLLLVPRQKQIHRPHVIAAQFPQGIGHKFTGNPLPPCHITISIIEWLGDTSGDSASLCDCFLI